MSLHTAMLDLIVNEGKSGEICNTDADIEWGNMDLEMNILTIGRKAESLPTAFNGWLRYPRHHATGGTELRCELGFMPSVSFDKGLAWTVRRYCEAGK